jgi:hypothetical protein
MFFFLRAKTRRRMIKDVCKDLWQARMIVNDVEQRMAEIRRDLRPILRSGTPPDPDTR